MCIDKNKLRQIAQEAEDLMEKPSDETCVKVWNERKALFETECGVLIEDEVRVYKRELHRNVFGVTMEFLNANRLLFLDAVLSSGFAAGCERDIPISKEDVRRLRAELNDYEPIAYKDDGLMRYAFFRRFYEYADGMYRLKDGRNLARHYYLNRARLSVESVELFLVNMSLLEVVQMDIERMRCDESYKLKDITSFRPFEVLDFVEPISAYSTVERSELNKIWIGLMVNSARILRRVRRWNGHGMVVREVECFASSGKGGGFSRLFVTAVVGVMKDMGVYNATINLLAETLAGREAEKRTFSDNMKKKFGTLDLLPESSRLVREIISR